MRMLELEKHVINMLRQEHADFVEHGVNSLLYPAYDDVEVFTAASIEVTLSIVVLASSYAPFYHIWNSLSPGKLLSGF